MLFYKLQLSYFKSYKILNFSYNHLANKRGITVNKIKIEKFVQGKINIKYYKNRHFQYGEKLHLKQLTKISWHFPHPPQTSCAK